MSIHPSSIIDKQVELAKDVEIGPFSVIRGRVKIGSGTKIDSHVSIGNPFGVVEIGEGNHFLPGAIVGGPPQDLSYKGEPTKLIIGDRNIIREFATVNCGTTKGGGVTQVGNECMLMAYVHVAHDCHFGNNVIVANGTQFAGHVTVEDHARIGGMVGIAQFLRIGKYAYVGGGAEIRKDIIPFCIADDVARATNKIGLSRSGFSKEEVENIYKAIRFLLMGGRTVEEAVAKIKEECEMSAHVQHLLNFIAASEKGIGR